jgi:ABC-type nitrate/sulfonate/bicarbonate transport system ATPase subunit
MSVLVRDLSYSYTSSEHVVFSGVSFETAGNEVLGLLGRSGCGKTTLINLLLGYLQPTKGSIVVDGSPVIGPAPSRAPIFQEDGLWPWFDAIENVTLPFLMRGGRASARAMEKRASEALVSCGLPSSALHRFPRQLSVGMRGRVQFGRILLLKPRMILADEPFTGLDAMTRSALRRLLLDVWHSTSATAFVATHDVDEALYLAHRILILTPDSPETLTQWENPFQGDEAAPEKHPERYFTFRNNLLAVIGGLQ